MSYRDKIREHVRLLAIAGAAAVAFTAVTAVAPGGPAARATTDSTPAITVADGNSVIAVQTASDGLRFYWNEHGTNNWHGEQVAADGTTFSAPSIAQVGNTVVIVAEGIFNSLDLYWQTNGASGWNAETVARIRTTYSVPSVVQDGNATIISAEGPSNSLDFYWAVNGSPTWNADPMPGGDVSQSSIVAYPGSPGGVHVVARELFGALADQTDVNGSGTWQYTTVCGQGLFNPECAVSAPSATMNGGLLNIADEDASGNLNFFWQDSSGTFHEELVDTGANLD